MIGVFNGFIARCISRLMRTGQWIFLSVRV